MMLKSILLIMTFKYIKISMGRIINIKKRIVRFIKHNKKPKNINIDKNYLNSIKNYINLIQQKKLENIEYINNIIQPKISFIAPVCNKEKYLESLILSIQQQLLEEFEIIFVDDYSNDKSVKIINKFSKFDRRIKLIKNKINKGTLYSRIQGALQSRGEYIIFIDSDDIVLKEGLYNAYKYIKIKKLSMVQFNSIFERNDSLIFSDRYYKYDMIIKQPILSHIFYYNEITNKADELNTALWDKLIQRETVIKAINFIGEEYYYEKIKIENDVIMLFSIFRMADSYQYINETGYYYIRNHNDSITNSWEIPEISSSVVHGVFVNVKFLYEKTKNIILDKSLSIFKLQQSFKRYLKCFANAKMEFSFMDEVLKMLISSKYIQYNDKIIISNIYSSISLFYKGNYLN